METIGVIGLGAVGKTLASVWKELGFRVEISSDDPATAEEAGRELNIFPSKMKDLVAQSTILLIAVPWKAVEQLIDDLGPESFNSKIIIDAVNPILEDRSGLEIGHDSSGGEKLQSLVNNSFVVKAFNTLHFSTYRDPLNSGQQATLFICGNDQNSKRKVSEIGKVMGLDPVDCGPLVMSRYLEPLGYLGAYLTYVQGFGPHSTMKWAYKG